MRGYELSPSSKTSISASTSSWYASSGNFQSARAMCVGRSQLIATVRVRSGAHGREGRSPSLHNQTARPAIEGPPLCATPVCHATAQPATAEAVRGRVSSFSAFEANEWPCPSYGLEPQLETCYSVPAYSNLEGRRLLLFPLRPPEPWAGVRRSPRTGGDHGRKRPAAPASSASLLSARIWSCSAVGSLPYFGIPDTSFNTIWRKLRIIESFVNHRGPRLSGLSRARDPDRETACGTPSVVPGMVPRCRFTPPEEVRS